MKVLVIVLIVAAGVAALGAAAFFLFFRGPDLKAFLPLKEPRIRQMDDEAVLQVAFEGKAETAIKDSFGVLFRAYFRLKGAPKGPAMKPPKARYVIPANLPADPVERFKAFGVGVWRGAVAIPVPPGLALPAQAATGLKAELATWRYGEVAEILHLGSYDSEPPTVKKLEDYIANRGYEIAGDHEEEYLKGPGMPFVQPKDYWTIVRYQVREKGAR
jgi:effector-binding domain-containing protein